MNVLVVTNHFMVEFETSSISCCEPGQAHGQRGPRESLLVFFTMDMLSHCHWNVYVCHPQIRAALNLGQKGWQRLMQRLIIHQCVENNWLLNLPSQMNHLSLYFYLSLCLCSCYLPPHPPPPKNKHTHQKSSNILEETERMQGLENEDRCCEILVTYLRPAQNLGPWHFNINRGRVLGVPTLAEELLLLNGCWRRSHFPSDI